MLEQKTIQNAIVIGAGIGGLTTALALRKQGFDVQVYEKAQQLLPVGAGLTLFPNGLNTLETIAPGIVQLLIDAGSPTHQVNIKKSSGETVFQKQQQLLENYGQPMLNIRWSLLQEILAAFLPSDIIHLNHRCVDFNQDENSVQVNFANGKTIYTDLLIGCDGINSAVRENLIKDGLPRYAGRLSWRAVIEYNHELLPPNEVFIITSNTGKIFTIIDVGGGYIFWSAAMLSEDDALSPREEVKSRVLQEYSGWTEPVEAIIQATPLEKIVERPICDRPPLKSWSQGRATLLGDAAHPMIPSLGQGANTAFEDAWELASYLSDCDNLEVALNKYDQSRVERTQIIQARSAIQGSRSYAADSDKFLSKAMQQTQISQSDFEDWLYQYNPDVFLS
ncbi:FAD-dependent monooxygenase [Rivularia sp. UHCC 0363]|uniref:FAD-dependent monooxygenase n=1 Tax=Rivularia sp. UHCC 0363 TaxID=3110244 RepID=UPI002B1EB586|nr:FAD-dependent monooxygenase [Rivularia sp. UHCC 0363]MEA5598906.1 FAD-dependent monooxygenase [Rivularia sp. UHCC 0363]